MPARTPLAKLDALDSLRLRDRWVYEPNESAWLQSWLRPGMRFADVGAHIGYYSAMAGRMVGPSGWGIAFEPEPENFAALRLNVAGLPVNCVMAAVTGPGSPPLELVRNPRNSGDNWVMPRIKGEQIPAINLDRHLSLINHPQIDFLKIDTQGHEARILSGASGTLSSVQAALVEVYPLGLARYGDEPRSIFSLAIAAGLGLYSVVGAAAGKTPSRLTEEEAIAMSPAGRHWNVLLLREGLRP